MKRKNPLYVVKGQDIIQANSWIELVIQKFNLRPLLDVLNQILNFLLGQVKDYGSLQLLRIFLERIYQPFLSFFKVFVF